MESVTQPSVQDVYRALKKQFFDAQTKEVFPDAYYCRPGNDFHGLSVRFSIDQHIQKRKVLPFKWNGIAEISVVEIESLDLKLVKDKEDHANIIGVPRREDCREKDREKDNYEELKDRLVYDDKKAEYLAGELAKYSCLVYVDS